MIAKSVEMICNSIAEMRTYGEGFVIVDQSPTAVDIAAIKNTNTKILMRLPEKGDCEAVGNAAGLNDDQIKEMAKLGTGIAVVMQNNWLEAVLTHIDAASDQYEKKMPTVSYGAVKEIRGKVVQELMLQYIVEKKMNLNRFLEIIDSVDISEYKREEMRCSMRYTVDRLMKGRDIEFFCETLMNLSGAKNLFPILEPYIRKANAEGEIYDGMSVNRWKNEFRRELNQYLDLPENYNNTIVKYLLHAQETEKNHIDYVEVNKLLY